MKMSNETYDFLKWVAQVLLPALTTLYGVIGSTCGIPYTTETLTIMGAVDAFMGTVLHINSTNYKEEENHDN